MGDPISILIALLVVAAITVLLVWVINQTALPEPIRSIFILIVAVVLLLLAVRWLGLA